MSRVDELPADQRAALSLLLRQRKSYAEVAGLLSIPERAVHDRAHAALAILAPVEARGVPADRRAEVSDYLLGQQAVGVRLRTRTLLAGDPAANAWAASVARELAPLGGQDPDLPPAPGAPAPADPQRMPLSQVAASAPAPQRDAPGAASSSRRGGAILLAVLAVAIVVAVIVILSDNGSSSHTGTGTATTKSSSSGPKQEGRFQLHAPAGSGSTGTVEILSEAGKRAFFIQAEHIPESKGFFYAVWLYSSPSHALALSKAPPVGASHKLAGAALLPSNASSYKEILLTRETQSRPRRPGRVVLRGKIAIE